MSYDHIPPPYRPVDGQLPSTAYTGAPVRTWETAPKIVKGWAYPLSWLGIVFWSLVMMSSAVMDEEMGLRIVAFLASAGFFAVMIWLNRGLKKGTQAAWILQIIFSTLWLLAFPLWTIVNGYVLSNWFKPETKAWFGQN